MFSAPRSLEVPTIYVEYVIGTRNIELLYFIYSIILLFSTFFSFSPLFNFPFYLRL